MRELFNLMGACVQLMSMDGELRWAFLNDPYITGRRLVPDQTQPVADGYANVRLSNPAYRGKYENVTAGEEYIEMISAWYRTGQQKITGGYPWHPVYYADRTDYVDSQGGACDNDVHEIFKCMEETVLKKAFLIEREDGSLCAYNCTAEKKADHIHVRLHDDTQWIHANFKTAHWIHCADRQIYGTAGRGFYDLTDCR